MEMPDIRSLVPHSGTMVLLDRVISADENTLCAEVVIRPDSLFYADGGVGAWVGIEYMAQAIGAYAGYRARLRGEFIRKAKDRRRDFTVDWVHLKLNDQAQRTVLCKDPFKAHDERVERLIASM